MGRIGNSFSHLILGLSQILQESGVDTSARTLSDASLQSFAFMSRELGRLMSTVTLARRQVWLAQSSLSEGCRRTLHSLPVVPGHMFGPAAQQALERSAQVDQARQRFAGLRRGPAQAPRQMGLLPSGPRCSHPPARPGAQLRSLYANQWKLFSQWCQTQGEVPETCSVAIVLRFLQSVLDAGRCASTLKVYAATISAGHTRVNNQTVGSGWSVFEGRTEAQAIKGHCSAVMELDVGFEVSVSAPIRTHGGGRTQTAFLLAITSAKRVGELHALSVSQMCLRWYPDGSGVTLLPNPSFLPKRGPPSQQATELSEQLCPVRALREYVGATALFRKSDQLFVCYGGCRKGQPLSKQRLSKWIVEVIVHAYTSQGLPAPSNVRCHSTRSVSTSWAALKGVSLQDICAAATWESSCTFARYYHINVAALPAVATAVLSAASMP
ncbi:hypothetical protein N1851_027136 [Merluccius polli]|uniref:Tyr recombinase domain-containing protein n=1 Tax=Merluccius polli TaxID=89951 RepID=A0AA47MAQ8_MERPO|nr:hypothetical protein N1851_027136 [Merluccius polli]